MIQGSDEWKRLRAGRLTASRIADMLAKTKSGWAASRANLMAQLVAERLTGEAAESYTSAAMQWGSDHEADARAAYEFYSDAEVAEIAFVEHPTIAMAGASPDGLVGEHGLVEFKCPNTATHLETLLSGKIPDKNVPQMFWQLACLPERRWCDFASFDPRMPENMRLFVKRLPRDDIRIAEMEKDARVFLDEVDEKVAGLLRVYSRPSPLCIMAAG